MKRTLESVLDPDTLRPHSIWTRRIMTMTIAGETQEANEERTATFDWAHGDCP